MPFFQLKKSFNPSEVEQRWGAYWIQHHLFQPSQGNQIAPYSLVLPPPNITGSLHIGHALNLTLQDILTRWRRMQGMKTLWIPGTDHAGIATQNIVERQLSEENLTRDQLGRHRFIERVWKWRNQSGDTIVQQMKHLGASCDWSRLRFTMDEGLSQAVREAFVQLYEDGLIYRGERLINWCPRCLTALSDIEVEHEAINGQLYHIRYPCSEDSTQFLTVATTRPETLLGDTAVAVHPDDPRFQRYIGKKVKVPLTARTIPVVADPILVDREFGTGAVKITPAHDFNDFEAGERHGLERLSLLDIEARMSPQGLHKAQVDQTLQTRLHLKPVTKARAIVLEALEKDGLFIKGESHGMSVGKCYRCKTVVEPYLSPQWFVKIQPLADPAIQAVETGQIRIIPEAWENNYLGWMRQIKDWCISRQIWWGHQIPAWYCQTCHQKHFSDFNPAQEASADTTGSTDRSTLSCFIPSELIPVVARSQPHSCPICGGSEFFQDPDVLDTWFSSSLWPFSTLGWPDRTEEYQTFYPTTTLVTGLDILFFWVARMIMMGLKFTGKPPFHDVYIHALIRDAEGRKMSKSKGNVIDPLTKMRQYGTDALRFTLASMSSPGRDIKLAEERIEGYRNFATKIWNAARFIVLHGDGPRTALPPQSRPFPDRWILNRLNQTIQVVNKALEQYRFDQAASSLYQFIWHEYCDWFIELAKFPLQQENHPDGPATRHTLLETFEVIQRLLHPVMPFITEEIWQSFPHDGSSIMTQPFPIENPEWVNEETLHEFTLIQSFINTTRTCRALLNVSSSQTPIIYGASSDDKHMATLSSLKPYMEYILRASVIVTNDALPTRTLQIPSGHSSTIAIPVPKEIDLVQIIEKIHKQIIEKRQELQRLEGRLASPAFKDKAEESVIQESETRRTKLLDELEILNLTDQQLASMSV